jgi:cytochrome c2
VSADPEKRDKAMSYFPKWERYERNVSSYLAVPSLTAAMARLEPAWVASYLVDPHDLRPSMPETMPRFDLEPDEIAAIVGAFGAARVEVPATEPPRLDRVAEGAEVFERRGCAACHTLGGLHTGPGLASAPDLAHSRHRMSPDMAAAWIADPKQISPDASMVSLGLSAEEILAVRDYIWLVEPGGTVPASSGPMPEPTRTPVSWAMVEERVFGKICVHCHMDPEANQGRRGPGNAGGFGWNETGIQLETRAGVMAVADRIGDALARRRVEAARDVVAPGERPVRGHRTERPGMPLGLPPLPDEDVALVLGWIAQGMPE